MQTLLAVLKKYLTIMAFGALLGVAAASWLGPSVLHWYSTPPTIPGSPPPMITCDGQVQWALTRLSQTIGGSALLFAVVFAAGAAFLGSVRQQKPSPSGTSGPANVDVTPKAP